MTLWTIKADAIAEDDGSANRTIRIVFDQDSGAGISITENTGAGKFQITPIGTASSLDIEFTAKGSGLTRSGGARVLTTTDSTSFDAAGSSAAVSATLSSHTASATAHGISAFGATLVDDASASAARNTLGLGSAAVEPAASAAAASTIPKSNSLGQLAREWIRPFFFDRRVTIVTHDVGTSGGTGTVSRVGLPADPTALGTCTNADTVSGAYETCTTGTTSGNVAGRITTTNVAFRDWNPRDTIKVLSAATITSMRWWVCYTSADVSGKATPTTEHVAGFRYDTGAGDNTAGAGSTPAWAFVTCDGSTATVTQGVAAFAGSTAYSLRVEMDEANAVIRGYVNDVLVAQHATNRPASATGVLKQWTVTTLTNAARKLSWSWWGQEAA